MPDWTKMLHVKRRGMHSVFLLATMLVSCACSFASDALKASSRADRKAET